MDNESMPGKGPDERRVGPGAESPTFEAWFLDRYSYTRAVLTNPIWAREISDASEAFAAGQAAERERCADPLPAAAVRKIKDVCDSLGLGAVAFAWRVQKAACWRA